MPLLQNTVKIQCSHGQIMRKKKQNDWGYIEVNLAKNDVIFGEWYLERKGKERRGGEERKGTGREGKEGRKGRGGKEERKEGEGERGRKVMRSIGRTETEERTEGGGKKKKGKRVRKE